MILLMIDHLQSQQDLDLTRASSWVSSEEQKKDDARNVLSLD